MSYSSTLLIQPMLEAFKTIKKVHSKYGNIKIDSLLIDKKPTSIEMTRFASQFMSSIIKFQKASQNIDSQRADKKGTAIMYYIFALLICLGVGGFGIVKLVMKLREMLKCPAYSGKDTMTVLCYLVLIVEVTFIFIFICSSILVKNLRIYDKAYDTNPRDVINNILKIVTITKFPTKDDPEVLVKTTSPILMYFYSKSISYKVTFEENEFSLNANNNYNMDLRSFIKGYNEASDDKINENGYLQPFDPEFDMKKTESELQKLDYYGQVLRIKKSMGYLNDLVLKSKDSVPALNLSGSGRNELLRDVAAVFLNGMSELDDLTISDSGQSVKMSKQQCYATCLNDPTCFAASHDGEMCRLARVGQDKLDFSPIQTKNPLLLKSLDTNVFIRGKGIANRESVFVDEPNCVDNKGCLLAPDKNMRAIKPDISYKEVYSKSPAASDVTYSFVENASSIVKKQGLPKNYGVLLAELKEYFITKCIDVISKKDVSKRMTLVQEDISFIDKEISAKTDSTTFSSIQGPLNDILMELPLRLVKEYSNSGETTVTSNMARFISYERFLDKMKNLTSKEFVDNFAYNMQEIKECSEGLIKLYDDYDISQENQDYVLSMLQSVAILFSMSGGIVSVLYLIKNFPTLFPKNKNTPGKKKVCKVPLEVETQKLNEVLSSNILKSKNHPPEKQDMKDSSESKNVTPGNIVQSQLVNKQSFFPNNGDTTTDSDNKLNLTDPHQNVSIYPKDVFQKGGQEQNEDVERILNNIANTLEEFEKKSTTVKHIDDLNQRIKDIYNGLLDNVDPNFKTSFDEEWISNQGEAGAKMIDQMFNEKNPYVEKLTHVQKLIQYVYERITDEFSKMGKDKIKKENNISMKIKESLGDKTKVRDLLSRVLQIQPDESALKKEVTSILDDVFSMPPQNEETNAPPILNQVTPQKENRKKINEDDPEDEDASIIIWNNLVTYVKRKLAKQNIDVQTGGADDDDEGTKDERFTKVYKALSETPSDPKQVLQSMKRLEDAIKEVPDDVISENFKPSLVNKIKTKYAEIKTLVENEKDSRYKSWITLLMLASASIISFFLIWVIREKKETVYQFNNNIIKNNGDIVKNSSAIVIDSIFTDLKLDQYGISVANFNMDETDKWGAIKKLIVNSDIKVNPKEMHSLYQIYLSTVSTIDAYDKCNNMIFNPDASMPFPTLELVLYTMLLSVCIAGAIVIVVILKPFYHFQKLRDLNYNMNKLKMGRPVHKDDLGMDDEEENEKESNNFKTVLYIAAIVGIILFTIIFTLLIIKGSNDLRGSLYSSILFETNQCYKN